LRGARKLFSLLGGISFLLKDVFLPLSVKHSSFFFLSPRAMEGRHSCAPLFAQRLKILPPPSHLGQLSGKRRGTFFSSSPTTLSSVRTDTITVTYFLLPLFCVLLSFVGFHSGNSRFASRQAEISLGAPATLTDPVEALEVFLARVFARFIPPCFTYDLNDVTFPKPPHW